MSHDCMGVDPALADQLRADLHAEPWLMHALEVVADSGLPSAWIGAGAVRDVVWGRRYGGFDPSQVRDVDVAFFDPSDLTPECDQRAQARLERLADLPWEATNQAAVHVWYHEYFGGPPVEPLTSVHDGIGTWPETATCVGVGLASSGIEVCAPHGLDDLLGGVWRRNPARVSAENSAARRARLTARWPGLTVVP